MSQDNRPLFSVIAPVYKVEKYIHQCVDSILTQTFSDFELILVDDGSPDNCGAVCDDYARKDQRVRVVHKENGGLVSARRAGYSICTGRYICNVDSDDYIAGNLLEMAAQKISAHQVDAVLFGYVHFDEHSSVCHPQGVRPGLYDGKKMDEIRATLIFGVDGGAAIHNGLWSLVMRKEQIDPYFTSFPMTVCRGEDLIVTAPALAQCSAVYVLEECAYFYRRTPGSIMNSRRGNELDQILTLAALLSEKMGSAYEPKLNTIVLRECYEHLSQYRGNRQEYRQEVARIRTDALVRHLRGAQCDRKASLSDKVAFFLLRHQLFDILWLIWRIKS